MSMEFERSLEMKRVLVAHDAWEDPPGTLGEMMLEWGILFDTVKVEEAPLPDLDHYDAFIILGGPQYAGDDKILPYLVREKELIRRAVAQDIPYLGVCLGGQLLPHPLPPQVHPNLHAHITFSNS